VAARVDARAHSAPEAAGGAAHPAAGATDPVVAATAPVLDPVASTTHPLTEAAGGLVQPAAGATDPIVAATAPVLDPGHPQTAMTVATRDSVLMLCVGLRDTATARANRDLMDAMFADDRFDRRRGASVAPMGNAVKDFSPVFLGGGKFGVSFWWLVFLGQWLM